MQFSKQKKLLVAEKEKLLRELDYYKKEDPFLIPGRQLTKATDDDVNETEGHDRITATSMALKKDLVQVEAALKRIEAGSYGVCSVCGDRIEEARLAVLPAATLCLNDEKKKH